MHYTRLAFRSTTMRSTRQRVNQERPANDDMVDTVVTASPASRTRRSTHPLIDIGMVPQPEFSTHGAYLPRGIPTDTPPSSPSREHSSATRHDNETCEGTLARLLPRPPRCTSRSPGLLSMPAKYRRVCSTCPLFCRASKSNLQLPKTTLAVKTRCFSYPTIRLLLFLFSMELLVTIPYTIT